MIELETKEKLKLMNIAKEWLRTEHSEGNVQSLVKLILSFTKPKDNRIAKLEAQIEKMKRDVFECFGSEYNMLVAKLFTEWEIKEK